MAAGLLLHHLHAAGHDASVTSAGTRAFSLPVDPVATGAVGELDVDISTHVPRQMDRTLLDDEGADLIITMTREHLRAVVASHRTTFPRTFTLRELLRRASVNGRSGVPFPEWVASVAEGRRAIDLMGDENGDDISDPYGLGRGRVASTAVELDVLIRQLVIAAPW